MLLSELPMYLHKHSNHRNTDNLDNHGTHVHRSSHRVCYFLPDFNPTLNMQTNFSKNPNSKCHENLSGSCQVLPCGITDMERPSVL